MVVSITTSMRMSASLVESRIDACSVSLERCTSWGSGFSGRVVRGYLYVFLGEKIGGNGHDSNVFGNT